MTVTELADYIVRYYNSVGDIVSNKKLNKVLYYVQGWHFAYFDGQPLFTEAPEAWVHGPVYPPVYAQYRWDNNITVSEEQCAPDVLKSKLEGFGLTKDQNDFLNSTLIHYSKKSGAELEIYTHRETPWLEARGDLASHVASNTPISLETMKSYFSDKLSATKKN